MEVMICVPNGTDITAIEKEFPDIYEDEGWDDGYQRYFVGKSSDEDLEEGQEEWLDYEEAIECCGFVEGLFPNSSTMIEGNGEWAQGMISETDFSGYAVSDSQKAKWQASSELYWAAHGRGKEAAARKS